MPGLLIGAKSAGKPGVVILCKATCLCSLEPEEEVVKFRSFNF